MSVLLIASSEMNVKLYSGFKKRTGSKVGTDRLNDNESLKKLHVIHSFIHSLMGKPLNTTQYIYMLLSLS